jgi:hypothetical protein
MKRQRMPFETAIIDVFPREYLNVAFVSFYTSEETYFRDWNECRNRDSRLYHGYPGS